MTFTRFHLKSSQPDDEEEEDDSSKTTASTTNGAAMRIIVPLQGVVQGRSGLVLGSLIPCAIFYFLQLYIKRNRSHPPSAPSPSPSSGHLSELPAIPRTQSRSHLSPRASVGPAPVSSRASSTVKSDASPYYVGLKKHKADPYHPSDNPNGFIQLGLAENKVDFVNFYFFRHHLLVKRCWSVEIFRFVFPVFFDLEQLSLDLVHEWIVRRSKEGSLLGGKDGDLSISGIATYQPADGLLELKMVRMILDIFALPFSS